MARYKVRRPSEEFTCPTCGEPVQVGDGAWDDGPEVYCSAYCAGADPGKQRSNEPSPGWLATEANAASGQ